MTSETKNTFLSLVRQGVGHHGDAVSPKVDWQAIEAIANQHGLSAIIIDGLEKLPDEQKPPKPVLLQWIGEVLQGYEYRYELYRRAIAELAGYYNSHSYKMMVLKGLACSLDWPKPEHRPCGDIDIWQFGKQKEADALLVKEKRVEIDNSHHHHSVFYWRDFMVENHYDFVNVHHNKSNASIEKVFKSLGSDDSYSVDVYGEKVYLPSPNLHALFLLRHSMIEFAASGITLRQLMDWAFFVEKHTSEIDWVWLEGILEEYGMRQLYDVYKAICVEDLGFDVRLFPSVQFLPSLKDKVLNEILEPAIPNEKPHNLFARVFWKYRRWKANEWKHKLVYKESMWSTFWSGVWNHLLKPSSI